MANFLIKKLSGLFARRACIYENIFEQIVGHDNIKQIFLRAMHSKRPVHVLLIGSPGSAKTMFLTQIMRNSKISYFVVGSNTTKAGLLNQLFQRMPKFLLIDELEKMNTQDQTALLHLMETGLISETKINKTRQSKLTCWVFSTANSTKKISEAVLSRFIVLEIPDYSVEEFTNIAIKRLASENIDEKVARIIAEKIWYKLGSRNIRDVINVARISDSIEEIDFFVEMLNAKYRPPVRH